MTVGIVTGAARGMGAACAARLADMVDVLLLVDRDEVLLATQADMLAAAGQRAAVEPFVLDVQDPGGIARLAARVAELGPLRAVAHAAGLSPTMADWREILTVNLVGTARLVRGLPCAGGAGDRGRLLRIGRRVARPRPGGPARPTPCSTIRWPTGSSRRSGRRSGPTWRTPAWPTRGASAGVHRLVRREAVRFGQVGARICSVTPGMIDTPMGRQEAEARDTSAMLVENDAHPPGGTPRGGGFRGGLPPLRGGELHQRDRSPGRRRPGGGHPRGGVALT